MNSVATQLSAIGPPDGLLPFGPSSALADPSHESSAGLSFLWALLGGGDCGSIDTGASTGTDVDFEQDFGLADSIDAGVEMTVPAAASPKFIADALIRSMLRSTFHLGGAPVGAMTFPVEADPSQEKIEAEVTAEDPELIWVPVEGGIDLFHTDVVQSDGDGPVDFAMAEDHTHEDHTNDEKDPSLEDLPGAALLEFGDARVLPETTATAVPPSPPAATAAAPQESRRDNVGFSVRHPASAPAHIPEAVSAARNPEPSVTPANGFNISGPDVRSTSDVPGNPNVSTKSPVLPAARHIPAEASASLAFELRLRDALGSKGMSPAGSRHTTQGVLAEQPDSLERPSPANVVSSQPEATINATHLAQEFGSVVKSTPPVPAALPQASAFNAQQREDIQAGQGNHDDQPQQPKTVAAAPERSRASETAIEEITRLSPGSSLPLSPVGAHHTSVTGPAGEFLRTVKPQSQTPDFAASNPQAPAPKDSMQTIPRKGVTAEIAVQVRTEGSAPVDVHLTERGGKLRVAVRTADAELRQVLRQDLHSLVGQLEKSGLHAETVTTPEPRVEPTSSTEMTMHAFQLEHISGRVLRAEATTDSSGEQAYPQSDRGAGQQQQQQNPRRPAPQAAWKQGLSPQAPTGAEEESR